MISRAALLATLFVSAAMAGPTPVPSVPPNTVIGNGAVTPVAEGRWNGADEAQAFFLYFDVVGREVRDMRWTVPFTCEYADGSFLNFPFTHSSISSTSFDDFLMLDSAGSVRRVIYASDSGHTVKVKMIIELNGSAGSVVMQGDSTEDPTGTGPVLDRCQFNGYRLRVTRTMATPPKPPAPCDAPGVAPSLCPTPSSR